MSNVNSCGVSPRQVNNGIYSGSSLSLLPVINLQHNPTTRDRNFPIFTFGRNGDETSADYGSIWYLSKFEGVTGSEPNAIWVKLGTGSSGPAIDFAVPAGSSPVFPDASGQIAFTSSSGTVVITGSTNAINLDITGGASAIEKFDVDAHTAPGTDPVVPLAGTIALTGAQVAPGVVGANVIRSDSLSANSITMEIQQTSAVAAKDTTKNGVSHFNSNHFTNDQGFISATGFSTSDLHGPKFIVGDTSNGANYSTIASAVAAASSGDTVYIQTGTYTENINLVASVYLAALGSDCAVSNSGSNAAAFTANVTIIGTITASYTGVVNIYGIKLQTNGAAALATTGSNTGRVRLINCYVYANDATGMTFNNSNFATNFINCYFRSTSTNLLFANTLCGGIEFEYCIFGLSSTASNSTHASGGMTMFGCYCNGFTFSTSSTATFKIYNSYLAFGDAILITTAGTGIANYISNSHLQPNNASAISIGAGTTVNVNNCVIQSSSVNAITGAGILKYAGLSFSDTSSTINTTTQTVSPMGPRILLGSSCQMVSGSGSPGGAVTAPKGSLYLRTDGSGVNDRAYINTDSGTTWTAIVTVA